MAIQIVELLPLPRAKHGNSMVASRARTRVGAHVRVSRTRALLFSRGATQTSPQQSNSK